VTHRREVKSRGEKVRTGWYQARLKSLAKRLWEKRYLLFKSEENMTEKEKEELVSLMEEDKKMGKMRSFLEGVWSLVGGLPQKLYIRNLCLLCSQGG